ncbi:LysR substrate-binding domain-containing protein [Vibrio sp. SS-MA-C1-2]|nr:LysR substrate-binding domain-containing protein [Vibrio sp. SS-MA-C1-2]
MLAKFNHHYPQIEIQLITGDPAQSIDKVNDNSVDIAIAAKPEHLSHNSLFIPIESVTMSVITPVALLNNQSDDLLAGRWEKIPFILPERGAARESIDKWCHQQQIIPTIYAQVSGHEAIVSMVALGCGIGIAPDIVIDNSPMKDKIKKIVGEPVEPLQLGLCCRQQRKKEPLITAFLALFDQ